MDKVQGVFQIVAQKKIASTFYRLTLDAPPIVRLSHPGQFVHVRIADGHEPFFRRPFGCSRVLNHLEIIYEVVGPGTQRLSAMKAGDALDVLGPLGRPFDLPPKTIEHVVMIAGGIGIAPLFQLSDVLTAKRQCRQTLIYGCRSQDQLLSLSAFKKNGGKVYVSTEDGSAAVKGRVSVFYDKIDTDPQKTMIYTCGPLPMMAHVREFAVAHGFSGQALLEEVMACGIGTCLGCAIKTKQGMKTVCSDGPVFDLEDILCKGDSCPASQ